MDADASYLWSKSYKKWFSLESFIMIGIAVLTSGAVQALFSGIIEDTDINARSLAIAKISKTDSVNPLRQILLIPMYLYAFFYVVRHFSVSLVFLRKAFPIALLSVLAILSSVWSLEPLVTFRRSSDLMLSTIMGFYLAIRYSPYHFSVILSRSMIVVCFITILAVLLDPAVAIHQGKHYPALRGFFVHKNDMGNAMIAGLLPGVLLLFSDSTRKLGLWSSFLSGTLLILSLSRTAWLVGAVLLFLVFSLIFIRSFKHRASFILVLGFITAFTFFLVISTYLYGNDLAQFLGRDATLSGRTILWERIIDAVGRGRFWLGYGYEVFWTSYQGALSLNWDMGGFIPLTAHNGWLQVFTHLGFIGVMVVCFVSVRGLTDGLFYARRAKGFVNYFCLLYIISYLLTNCTESFFMSRDRLYWIVFVYCVVKVPSYYLEKKGKMRKKLYVRNAVTQ